MNKIKSKKNETVGYKAQSLKKLEGQLVYQRREHDECLALLSPNPVYLVYEEVILPRRAWMIKWMMLNVFNSFLKANTEEIFH